MWIIKNNTVGMKGAYGNAGANTKFRRHRLLSLLALEDLASSSSTPPAQGAELKSTEEKTEHRSQSCSDCLCNAVVSTAYSREKLI